ncbi:MAG: polyprenyl diphosphate synthase, partial [Candidatus Baumannia cicadellinicola]|nr:polyprenyl diphosphate synthase [Candidatus Baumannia cicadellinicola]
MILKENQQHNKQHAISPQHVAIIMDGNGRWAKKQSKLPIFGHQAGVKSVRRAISFAVQHKLKALTLYAFSRENWHRPVQDVSALMELFIRLLDSKINILHKHNICLNIIGDIDRFSFRLQELICRAETLTSKNDGLNLNIAANYSGRWDIIKSVKKIAIKIQQGMLRPDQINEEILSRYICMNKLA